MAQVNTGSNRMQKAIKYLDLLDEAAEIWASVRDQPKTIDWLAFGARCVKLAYRTRNEWIHRDTLPAWGFIDNNDEEWRPLSSDIAKLVTSYVADVRVVPEYWNGDPECFMLVEGNIGGEVVRWVQESLNNPTMARGPYIRITSEDSLIKEVGLRLWRDLGATSVLYARGNVTPDRSAENRGVVTTESQALYERLLAFYQAGETHSCLLVGPPGAGKSTAIRQVAARLGLKALKISVSSLMAEDGGNKSFTPSTLDGVRAVIRMLQADVLILEDLDRLVGDSDLLDLMEVARLTSRLVIASANATEDMMGALLRPGRFDDVVTYTGLEPHLTLELAGHDEEIATRLRQLPLVYAYEYAKRLRVLGPERAKEELDELEARAARCAEDP